MRMHAIKKFLFIITIFSFIALNANLSGINIDYIDKKNICISHQGGVLYVGGDGPGNYTRIKDAINDANPGDTIFVYDDSSPYYENLQIQKSINLIGENKDTTIIDGGKKGDVVFITANKVNITGFTIQNSGGVIPGGIKVRSNYNTIADNIIKNNPEGIWLYDASYNTIIKNNLSNNHEFGINLYHSRRNSVSNNSVYNGSLFGIYLFLESDENTVTGNMINNYGTGIHIEGSSNHIISDNEIYQCDWGIWGKTSNNVISGNTVINIKYYGIWGEICNSIFTFNNISNSDQAVFLRFSTNNEITKNVISKNIKGLYLWYSGNNNITFNTFSKNIRDVFFKDCSNNWDQNFWRRPRYFPKIIIGGKTVESLVYMMPWFEIEIHPAKEPYDI